MLFGHGDDYYNAPREVQSNFSSNVWYGANLTDLKRHLFEEFDYLTRYPEPDAASLKMLLGEVHGVPSGNLLVTNGSITAFYLLAQAFEGAKSTIWVPSFAEYEDACKLYRHRIRYVKNTESSAQIDYSSEDLCWICNPNNPDGYFREKEELLNWLQRYPETLFVIDQAYADFVEADTLSLNEVNRFPNLIIIQSISKVHKIPGIRIGYLAAAETVIRKIQPYIIPWSVNSLAIEAGKYALKHPDLFRLPLGYWRKNALTLMKELAAIPNIEVMPSATTFFLSKLRCGKAADLKQYLLEEQGMLIRDASNFRSLSAGHFRISAQTLKENHRLAEAIRSWTEREGWI